MQTSETSMQDSAARPELVGEPRAGAAGSAGVGIEIKNVSKYFRRTKSEQPQAALLNVSLSMQAGTFVCLVGPSGCGKSTLLNMIGGFLRPDRGEIAANRRGPTGG
jgi:ABC-type Fe3+/spermidine/putrescine transport system ATPase subunit